MLKLRILTALVLLPVFVCAVIFLNPPAFALMMAVVILLGTWEWTAISGYDRKPVKFAYIFLMALLMSGAYQFGFKLLIIPVNSCSVIFWLFALWLVISCQRQGLKKLAVPKSLLGLVVLLPAWMSLLVLRETEPEGVKLVLFLLVLIWSADIAAYFCGRKWGKRKLCAEVSPGKSWEGVYGAIAAAIVLALAAGSYYGLANSELILFAGICVFTVLASILGDLFESLMKRLANMKDSGNLLPGHGGVLDRIDSLTAALPVFISLLWLWRKII